MWNVADIGHLTEEKGAFFGRVRTLGFKLLIELQPNEDRRGEGSPDFIVYAREAGDLIAIGGAWKKEVGGGRNKGDRFLSITMDDPGFPAPLNVAAFPGADGLPWTIVWTRPRAVNREAAA